jgi:hypothetical protein
MPVQFLGIRKERPNRFVIRLGKILDTKNYRQRER